MRHRVERINPPPPASWISATTPRRSSRISSITLPTSPGVVMVLAPIPGFYRGTWPLSIARRAPYSPHPAGAAHRNNPSTSEK